MTMNCYKLDFFGEFRGIWQICEATTAKRMKIRYDTIEEINVDSKAEYTA